MEEKVHIDEQHRVHSEETEDITEEYQVHESPLYFKILLWGLVIWGILYTGWFFVSGWDSEARFDKKLATSQKSE